MTRKQDPAMDKMFAVHLSSRTVHILAYDAEDAAWAGLAIAKSSNDYLVNIEPINETHGFK